MGIGDLQAKDANGKKATRPCPCGFLGHYANRCRCTPDQIARYRSRVSGPLLDRIDLQIEVPALAPENLASTPDGEASAAIRGRAVCARERQLERQGKPNAELTAPEVEEHCRPDTAGAALMARAISKLGLSARGYHRVLKVARSIADLAGAPRLTALHVGEAIGYRSADRR